MVELHSKLKEEILYLKSCRLSDKQIEKCLINKGLLDKSFADEIAEQITSVQPSSFNVLNFKSKEL